MQIYAYTDEVIQRLNAYARSIGPPVRVNYDLVHPEVYVPPGCLPIKVTQYFRWDSAGQCPRPSHWAIFVSTSPVPGVGNHYELAGDEQPYRVKSTIDGYNARRGFERGSHTVGYVLPLMLPRLEAHLALVPVENMKRFWNSQNWVCDALRGLSHPLMSAVGMPLERLVVQLAIVSAAWEAGDVDSNVRWC